VSTIHRVFIDGDFDSWWGMTVVRWRLLWWTVGTLRCDHDWQFYAVAPEPGTGTMRRECPKCGSVEYVGPRSRQWISDPERCYLPSRKRP